MNHVFWGLMVPFIGTALGSAAVFFMRRSLSTAVTKALNGFAAGVMTAASVWSLIIPATEQSSRLGRLQFIPPVIGFWLGVLFLILLERLIPRLCHKAMHTGSREKRTLMMVLAVTLHNIPEGMAVGVVYAGFLSGNADITAGGAFALALGIAIQNFPEGAIISMPLHAGGQKKPRAFLSGVLSGAVEPLFGALTILFAGLVIPAMPYLLSFAAGAMIYVVAEELLPDAAGEGRSRIGVLLFAFGFTVMMALDVALG